MMNGKYFRFSRMKDLYNRAIFFLFEQQSLLWHIGHGDSIPTTLEAMRDKYRDVLADWHCLGKNIYEVDLFGYDPTHVNHVTRKTTTTHAPHHATRTTHRHGHTTGNGINVITNPVNPTMVTHSLPPGSDGEHLSIMISYYSMLLALASCLINVSSRN